MNKIKKSHCRHTSTCKGFTLLELIIAAGMFLLLLGLLFFTYYQSTNAMLKGSVQSGFLQSAQVLSKKLTKMIHLAPAPSLTIASTGNGMSVLSAEDAQGDFQFDPALSVALWQKYQILYHDAANSQITLTEQSVVGFTEEANPGPIEFWDAAQPIESYFLGGKPLIGQVTAAIFSQPSPGTIRLEATLEQERSHSKGPEVFQFEINRSFRN